jgi:hypothetical protein
VALAHYFSFDYESPSGETGNPIIPRSSTRLPLACRRAGQARPDRRRKGSSGESDRNRTGIVRDLYVRGRVPWVRPEDHAHMLNGLRKAGMPEE